jgi:uncharacterized membrane protein YdbT with pleckstrin-like domain
MIYETFKGALLGIMKAPADPPPPPAGSPGSVETFRASPKFLYYRVVTCLLGWLVPLGGVAAGALTSGAHGEGVTAAVLVGGLVILALLCGVGILLIRLEYDVRYYVVTDRAIRIREGIWTIKEITLTFANVQDLEITRGPIQQLLGIGDLFVRTAGGGGGAAQAEAAGGAAVNSGHQAAFRGIENAAEVRDKVSALLRHYRDAGLGDPEDVHTRRAAADPKSGGGSLASPEVAGLLKEIRDGLRAYRLRVPGPGQKPAQG